MTESNVEVQRAIDAGDTDALRRRVEREPERVDASIRWGARGNNVSCPLHYVCDMRFEGRFDEARALELAEVLVAAGADVDSAHERTGDTPLIAAASLAAESVGLRLLEAGADPLARGIHRATALHWAALIGLDRLVEALIDAGAEIDLLDAEYESTPLRWALQGWAEPPNGNRGRQVECAARLVAAGATVQPGWMDSARVKADARMLAALRQAPRGG